MGEDRQSASTGCEIGWQERKAICCVDPESLSALLRACSANGDRLTVPLDDSEKATMTNRISQIAQKIMETLRSVGPEALSADAFAQMRIIEQNFEADFK
jgi:hypothetical protein